MRPSPARETQITAADGEAARVQAVARDDARTFELQLPLRKRYTMRLDLDARPPAISQPNAPRAVLDL